MNERLHFKLASEPWEIEEIHRLNYRTFVEEIPQHSPNAEKRLVDRFHAENTYIVCIAEEADGTRRLAGMVAMRKQRPFSLDQKVPDLDRYLPHGRTICEVRLFAVDRSFRKGAVAPGLLRCVVQHSRETGIEFGIISATTRELRLYRHMGFEPFGPLLGGGEATFQPMIVSMETFVDSTPSVVSADRDPEEPVNLLPGPVAIAPEVRSAFEQAPVSTRSGAFMERFHETRERLRQLARARAVEILLGSGTLANDVVAGQLSLRRERGLLLSNGEFGERLIDHARRAGLAFDALQLEWGRPFEELDLERFVRAHPEARWIWAAHCETSTGVLNDQALLERVAARSRMELCLDCISSIGLVPVDLTRVLFASAVSGKALGGYPGLSLVFHREPVEPAPDALPRYLDLGAWVQADGVPFTHSSNLILALRAALERAAPPEVFLERARVSSWLRSRLVEIGYDVLGDERHAAPGVLTLVLPHSISSRRFGMRLEREGFLISYRSGYLLRRNWVQVCLMGRVGPGDLEALVGALAKYAPVHDAQDRGMGAVMAGEGPLA